MILALRFGNLWLLIGLLAAAIPIVLHLLSSVRAPQMVFPTLRFLRISMQKTARRRKLEHWLLLLVRSLLLALLASAVAEPILEGAQGFWAGKRFAAAVIVDNSYSMGARADGATCLARAVRQASGLLEGDAKPSAATLTFTNSAAGPRDLTADLAQLRDALTKARLSSGRAPLAERIAEAGDRLIGDTAGQKAVYVFTDLQKVSCRDLAPLEAMRRANIPVMLIDCSAGPVRNVGIADLTVTGRRVAGQRVQFAATLVNSSPTDQAVEVLLQVDGRQSGDKVRQVLSAAGRAGATAAVRFHHRFTTGGVHVGRVAIADSDALPADNVRRFSLDIAERVNVLLVRGGAQPGGAFDPVRMLMPALDPYEGSLSAWSIRPKTVSLDQLTPEALAAAQVVVLADVASFSVAQADRIQAFVRGGGALVVFLGPNVNPDNYNDVFVQRVTDFGGLLPGRIGRAVGQVGLTAEAVRAVADHRHPYLAGLYETDGDYPDVLFQRYFRLGGNVAAAEDLFSAPAGDRIVAAKDFGDGRVVLFASTASVEWNNLATTALLLPMIERICLDAGQRLGGDRTHPAGAAVTIRPTAVPAGQAAVNVKTPDGSVEVLPLTADAAGHSVVFTGTDQLGEYEWQVVGSEPQTPGASGVFVTNMDGVETDLAAAAPAAVAAAVRPADVYVGKSVAEVHALAADVAAGDNLWDRLLAVVILLLVVEAVIANRFRRGAEPVPARLNPDLAP